MIGSAEFVEENSEFEETGFHLGSFICGRLVLSQDAARFALFGEGGVEYDTVDEDLSGFSTDTRRFVEFLFSLSLSEKVGRFEGSEDTRGPVDND